MKTADLTGALLDYWTARAEGVPADQLEIRPVQRPDPRTPDAILVRRMPYRDPIIGPDEVALPYSTGWWLGGPLIEKLRTDILCQSSSGWQVTGETPQGYDYAAEGNTLLTAICRAVVYKTFGYVVPD